MNQAERPLEDAPPREAIGAEEKALKNAEEVARWDEKKKWEMKVENFKRKLEEANEEVSKERIPISQVRTRIWGRNSSNLGPKFKQICHFIP